MKKTENKNSNVTKRAPRVSTNKKKKNTVKVEVDNKKDELKFVDGSYTEGFIPSENFKNVEAAIIKELDDREFSRRITNLIEFYKPKRKYVRKKKDE